MASMILGRLASYSQEGTRRPDIELEQISDALADPDVSFVWVGLYEP